MKFNILPSARKTSLVVQDAGSDVLVYDMLTNKAICLNATSAFVWQNCNNENSVSDIAAAMGRKFGSKVDEPLVWLAIEQLSSNDLLESWVSTPHQLSGLSRRDVIAKIGLGAMIALPVVASLVAPPAAHASSVCGSACQTSMQCGGTVCTSCLGGLGRRTCQAT